MTFDDRLRDELRRATASQPLDTDAALDAVRGAATAPVAAEPPVVALEDVAVPRPRRVRTQRLVGVAAAIAIVIGAIAIPLALRDDSHDAAQRKPTHPKHLSVNRAALRAVASALDATTSVGSFRVAYTMSEEPGLQTTGPCPTIAPGEVLGNGVNERPGAGAASHCVLADTNHVTTTGFATVN